MKINFFDRQITILILAILVIMAAPEHMPLVYENTVELLIFIVSTFISLSFIFHRLFLWGSIFVVIAIVYNPIYLLLQNNESYILVDFITAVICFFLSYVSLDKKTDSEDLFITSEIDL